MSCKCGGCAPSLMTIDCSEMCKDGLSAYELWVINQPADADTSKEAFWTYLKGVGVVSVNVYSEVIHES